MNRTCIAAATLALATNAAFAADLPSRVTPPVYVPPPVGYSWTGVEFGLTTSISFAGNRGETTVGNTPAAAAAVGARGIGGLSLNKFGTDYVGGGVGYNYQFTPGSGVVLGVMGDASYFDLSKTLTVIGAGNSASIFHERLGYLATINGRIGYAFDRVLVYGTGGFAFGGVHDGASLYGAGAGPLLFTGSANPTSTGYDFGGGVEYAIPPDSFLNKLSIEKLIGIDKTLGLDVFEGTIRAEFIHYNLGSQTVTLASTTGGPDSFTSRFKSEGNVVRLGLGYKFSPAPAPVVARY